MARIAFFHNALGKTDGVSLEVDKWKIVLENMGHEVFYCAGNSDVKDVFCIPELSFDEPLTNKILTNSTVKLIDYKSEAELSKDIYAQAKVIKKKVLSFITNNRIDLLIPNNLMSVGYHIPALIAIYEIIKETELPTISHNHDFYFEDSKEVSATCGLVEKIWEEFAPPAFHNVRNVVINKIAQEELVKRKGIRSMVVPNVFDFTQMPWTQDEYNSDFRRNARIGENDIVFVQATRILDRKGIELAIDVVAELNKPENRQKLYESPLYNGKRFTPKDQIVLLCSGYVEQFGISGDYYGNLIKKAKERGIVFNYAGDIVKHSRSAQKEEKIYSLWDSYTHSDFVTYPSIWEGWGNQFIEAIFAKLPVVLFEYPVYSSDLKKNGFEVVSLGEVISGRDADGLVKVPEETIKTSISKVIDILTNSKIRAEMVQKNFEIAKSNYSFEVLRECIEKLLHSF